VYSGSAPSQPLDTDVGFYRRVDFDSPPSTPVTIVAPKKKAKTKKRQPVRLQKRVDDGGDNDDVDVEVFASQAVVPSLQCAVCGSPAREGNLCASCANDMIAAPATPPAATIAGAILVATRDLTANVVPCLLQSHKKSATVMDVASFDAGEFSCLLYIWVSSDDKQTISWARVWLCCVARRRTLPGARRMCWQTLPVRKNATIALC